MKDATTSCLPALPSGYSAVAPWGFHADGLAYEFFRVYGRVEGTGDRGAFCQLDEDLSYWAVSYGMGDAAHEQVVGRWINYEEARRLPGPALRFQRFSSPLAMREQVPRMLGMSETPSGR